jgi:hypothetical protein
MSAILNIGKLQMDMKSLTAHKNILSIKFPSVQAISMLKIVGDICFFLSKYENMMIANKLTDIMMVLFTDIPREIQKFSVAWIISKLERKFWL